MGELLLNIFGFGVLIALSVGAVFQVAKEQTEAWRRIVYFIGTFILFTIIFILFSGDVPEWGR